jgi:gluconate 2-dehydrogenase gamma chain
MISTRRSWLSDLAYLTIWADVAAAQEHARQAMTNSEKKHFETLDGVEAKEIEALAEQILPSDDGPGARETGVIYFIDRALTTFDSDRREMYRSGLVNVQKERGKLFPGSVSIAALTPGQQMELMRAIETTEFFDLLRTHTVLAFLADPKYGGNQDGAGWKYIEFEHRMAYRPPFGYYDAQFSGGKE